MEVAILGTGTIGSTVAYTLSVSNPQLDFTLVDVDDELADAHATDIRHARCHASHPAGTRDGILGSTQAAEAGPSGIESADVLVVAASTPRPPDSAQRGGRVHFLEKNLEIATEIGGWLSAIDPRPVVVVTNPLDPITHRIWTASGWPRRHVIGYSLSETARLADWIATRADVSPSAVSCPIMGEHGEYIVPLFSRATAGGEPLSLTPEERQDAMDFTRDAPYDIIEKRGAEESSRWVTARGVGLLVERLVDGGSDDPICVSVPLDGEYGAEDVVLSVPVRLDGSGWTEILDWDLSDWERDRFAAAADSVDEMLR